MDRLKRSAEGGLSRLFVRLGHLEQSERTRAAVCAGILLAAFALMWRLTALTPLEMDDYDYRISWSTGEPVSGVADVLASQAAHYRLWGGRSVVHALAQLFLWLDKGVFNVANAAAYALLLLEIYALARPGKRRFCWTVLLAAQAALFLCVPFFGTVFLWLTGACNYLWGTVIALTPLLIARSADEGGRFSSAGAWSVCAVIAGFLAGWTNENTACAVFAMSLLRLVDRRLRRCKIPGWQWAMLAAQGVGIALMLLAPGNFARASGVGQAPALALRVAQALLYGALYLAVPAVALLLLSGLLKALGLPARLGRAGALTLGALLGCLALAASPVISDRSYTGPFVLALAGALTLLADLEAGCRPLDAYRLCALPLCALLLAYGGVGAAGETASHAGAWNTQVERIEEAAARGDAEVSAQSVPSHSRFTMDIMLAEKPAQWPNATLSKTFGVAIRGESARNASDGLSE